MIGIHIDRLLEEYGRTFYWLAKETGISHTTLWRLKKDKALGINFITLEKLCEALDCQPGDLLSFTNQKKGSQKKESSNSQADQTHPANSTLIIVPVQIAPDRRSLCNLFV